MHRRTFVALSLGAALTGCATAGRITMPQDTTLILLRHGDRASDQLSEKGVARARALVPALEGIAIDRIYSPGLDRNLATAAPLANARRLEITRIPPTGVAQRILSESTGLTSVWVGNKGNLTEIWDTLELPGAPPLEYGDLAIVKADRRGRPQVTRLRFGAELDG